ncbi:MAG: ABC transporter permease [Phycisphaerae bacterium]
MTQTTRTAPENRPAEIVALPSRGAQSQWQLIRKRFCRHKLALASLFVLMVLYTVAIAAGFFAPYPKEFENLDYAYCPPQPLQFDFTHGLHIRALAPHVDPVTYKKSYTRTDQVIPLGFFVRGRSYRFWGLFQTDLHFFGIDNNSWDGSALLVDNPAGGQMEVQPAFYLLGADEYGRDLLSRIIYGARISLSIGLVAIVVTFILGLTIGGISGYVGGRLDNVIQRGIEIINSFPRLPLWLALGAAVPTDWSPLKVYFGITLVLALLGWTGLARVVRGKLLSLREEEYATAARLLGAGHGRIIFRHLLPGFTSHIIVSLTLRVPTMILGETSLSFLGLGLRPPVVSWGVMLRDAWNMEVVANYPWLLLPVVFIILVVLSCNFLGDGLRDAADPYSTN